MFVELLARDGNAYDWTLLVSLIGQGFHSDGAAVDIGGCLAMAKNTFVFLCGQLSDGDAGDKSKKSHNI